MSSKLAEILFKDYRKRVLVLLLLNPDKRYHVREIARITGTIAGTLHKELARLADAGILTKASIGNQVQYSADKHCPVFDELVSILQKLSADTNEQAPGKTPEMDALVEKNRNRILQLARKNGVRNVRVFGSMARNEADANSDLDLLVDLEQGKSGLALGGFLADVARLTQRKVDVVTEKSLHPHIRDKILHEAIAL